MTAAEISHAPLTLEEIGQARERIADGSIRTPLVRLDAGLPDTEIHLKLEVLQPVGSFKIRGAGSLIGSLSDEELTDGVWTTSAGNMAQAVAWYARRRGIPATVVMPDTAPDAKRAAAERLGATVIPVTFAEWIGVFRSRTYPGMKGAFVHPFSDRRVMAGNATIGLEVLEDLPDVDAVVIPYGGGGLATGIASAIRALRPETKIYTAEPETGAALAAAVAAGHPVDIDYQASFVDGAGSRRVLDTMWPLITPLIDGALSVSVAEVAAAVRLMAERARVIAEGAGALALAAALSGQAGSGTVVCVVSGGNINLDKLAEILGGADG